MEDLELSLRLEKVENDVKEIKDDIKELKTEDIHLKIAIQDLRETMIELNTTLTSALGIGKWIFGIAGTTIGALLTAILISIARRM